MATGDILSCTIRADGWSADVVIEGFAPGATYDFGSLGSTPATIATPKFALTVVSEGYNASGVLGTITRTVYGTKVVRKPYPNQATPDETGGGNLTVRVALSESVYNDDKNGGAGTSGTNPTVTIATGWCVNTAGGAQSSAAAVALACTNNSTLDYPKVIAQWAWGHTPAWRRVEGAFAIGAIAMHGHGIACVALSATGNSSAFAVGGTATSKIKHLTSASGLYYESYDLAVPDLASFTQGEDVTLRYIAYPLVGDADSIIDTNANTTSNNEVLGWNKITCTCDKTGALKDYAVVSTTGNDTTGAKSTVLATAEGTPFLTIGKALASGASVVYVRAGTVDILGSTPASVAAKNYFIEVLPYPSESATLTRVGTHKAYKATKLRYSGFTVTGSSWIDGSATATTKLWFDTCTFSGTVNNATSGLGYRAEGTWFTGCTWASEDTFGSLAVSIAYSFTGCQLSAGGVIAACPTLVATKITGGITDRTRLIEKGSSIAPLTSNMLYAWSALMAAATSASNMINIGQAADLTGIAFVGNAVESKSGAQPNLWIGGDASTTALRNILVAHNTVAGQRCNLFYNDTGATANVRENIFCRDNAFRSYNIKSDTFITQDGGRIGNWAQMNGVNYSDNRFDGTASSTFINDYNGINTAFVDAADTTYGQLGFTDDNSLDGDGTGNGDYLPAVGSPLRGHTLRQSYISYDMLGNSINQEIGAFQVLAAAGGASGLSKGVGFALALGF